MITIDEDVKLDYSDVLMVPKPSNIVSRNDVDLLDTLPFVGSTIPIIAANMDHIGTFVMAETLASHHIMTALVKHYEVGELVDFFAKHKKGSDVPRFTFISTGINERDIDKLYWFYEENAKMDNPSPAGICIDVANGYSDKFLRV